MMNILEEGPEKLALNLSLLYAIQHCKTDGHKTDAHGGLNIHCRDSFIIFVLQNELLSSPK